jgi:hypothetical protein
MADPLSIVAIAGLAYLGKKLSEPKPVKKELYETQQEVKLEPPPPPSQVVDESMLRMPDRKMEVANFGVVAPQSRSNGSEILSMRNRMYDAGRMNNISPVEKQLVGPGLGVGQNVPAFGGYQQLFRVNPENVGAYRLTTLPGRSGPAMDIKGGRRGIVGEVAHNRPEKTAFLPGRRPEQFGRAQGMSGVIPRGEHEQTKRLTNRSVTGQRDDALGFSGAKRVVSAGTLTQDPTRNKKDGNMEQFAYNNLPAPNIHSFAHGYVNAPASKIGEKRTYGTPHTVEELVAYGFRPDERRGKPNRQGNAGRMNVRAGALNQGGMPTAARVDVTRVDGRTGPVNGGWTQQYKNDSIHQYNVYKGHENPYATSASLDVAKNQLQNNPIAQQMY